MTREEYLKLLHVYDTLNLVFLSMPKGVPVTGDQNGSINVALNEFYTVLVNANPDTVEGQPWSEKV